MFEVVAILQGFLTSLGVRKGKESAGRAAHLTEVKTCKANRLEANVAQIGRQDATAVCFQKRCQLAPSDGWLRVVLFFQWPDRNAGAGPRDPIAGASLMRTCQHGRVP